MKKIYSLLFLTMLLIASAAHSAMARGRSAAPAGNSESALKEQGKALCYAGRYAEAVPFLEKAVRQNRRSGALFYLSICRQHLYDFDGAIEAAETYQSAVNAQVWKERCDSIIEECRIGQRAFNHIQDIAIIDSMTVAKDDFFSHYRLGAESGRICQASDGLLYYENQAGDYRIETSGHGFEERHRFQGTWDEAHPLQGLGSENFSLLYPFQRSDGETLFFACDSIPGMGGFDIYRTTYSSEEGSFYQPERLGMPFNSPFNDYMMAIDETHQVGWWATDRNAAEDQVTIYLFLFDDEASYLDESDVSRARIDNIRETWREEEGYADLLRQIREAPQEAVAEKPSLHIVIDDTHIYSSEEEFRNPQALAAYRQSEALTQKIVSEKADLEARRIEYHQAGSRRRDALRPSILKSEENLQNLYNQQREAVKRYRLLELQ